MEEVVEQTFVGKSEINNIFDLPPTQIAIQEGSYVTHKCSEVSDQHSIVFDFAVDANHYADLSKSYLTFNAKIEGASGTDNKVGPVNLWGHSCFSQINVRLNDVQVNLNSNNMYPYEAMLTTLLSYGADAKNTHLAVAGYASDDAGKMDDHDPTENGCNTGLVTRAAAVNGGGTTELLIRPHINIFQQERLLPPGTKIGMTLIPSASIFNLMGDDDGTTKWKTVISNPRLHLRRVQLSTTTEMAHITEKMKGTPMRYPVRDLHGKFRTINIGAPDYHQTILTGTIPRRLWVCMVKTTARHGKYKENPFNFQHFNMSSIQLKVAGKLVPPEDISVDFATDMYKQLYFNLFAQTDNMFDDRGNGISFSDFKNGFAVFAFDLTADLEDGEHMELIKKGDVDLMIRFKTPVTGSAIDVITVSEFENIISISGTNQQVSRTWRQAN